MQRDMSVIDAGDLLRAACVHSAGWRHWRQLRGGTCLTMLTLSCVDVVCSWSRCFFFPVVSPGWRRARYTKPRPMTQDHLAMCVGHRWRSYGVAGSCSKEEEK
jgi:hypothetical protein